MGWVDRVNAAVLRRLNPNPAPAMAAKLATRVEDIARLVATRQPGYIGDTTILVAELASGDILGADEHDAEWPVLLTALDRSGRTALSSMEWTLRLAADCTVPIVLIGDIDEADPA